MNTLSMLGVVLCGLLFLFAGVTVLLWADDRMARRAGARPPRQSRHRAFPRSVALRVGRSGIGPRLDIQTTQPDSPPGNPPQATNQETPMSQIASATYEYDTTAKVETGPARIDRLLGDLDAGLDLLAKQASVLRSRLAPVSVDRGSVPSEGPQDSPLASPVADRIDTAISRVRSLASSLAEATDQLEI